MGLGDFVSGIKDAAVNVGKGALWAADPTHWDDIAEGVGNAAEFVAENPGKTWDTAFEVGRAVVKDQLDPVNLAINAGLLAATVATGGAAAPAFVAKLGLGAKSLEAGVSAAKGIDTAVDVAKGVDTALDAAKAVKTTTRAVEAGTTAVKAGEAAEDVTQAARTGSKLVRAVDKGLGLEPGKFGRTASNVLNPLENSRFGMAAMRERGAQRMLEAGGEAPSLMRQAGAALLQGGGRGAGGPTQLAGMSDKIYAGQKMLARGQAVGKRIGQAQQFGSAVEVAADPYAAAEGQVTKAIDERAAANSSNYVDRGQTAESLYGDMGATPPPGGSSSGPGSSQVESPGESSSVKQPVNRGAWRPTGQHFWEGPRSQWAGGIQAGYDWRPVDPLRRISSPTPGQASRYKSYKGQMSDLQTAGGGEPSSVTAPATGVERDLNEQGAPTSFSPEVPKSGMYALSAGQSPDASAFPKMLDSGPTVRATSRTAGRSQMYAQNVRTAAQPIGAIGPAKAATGVIDVDSSSPDDYSFDNSGQGYFTFPEIGTAALGPQPNTSPMYQQGSRTSRRPAGTLGV